MRPEHALLKALTGRAEEHQVVGEDPEREFAPLRSRAAGGEGGAEAALVLAEAALDSLDANDKPGCRSGLAWSG